MEWVVSFSTSKIKRYHEVGETIEKQVAGCKRFKTENGEKIYAGTLHREGRYIKKEEGKITINMTEKSEGIIIYLPKIAYKSVHAYIL